MTANIASVGSRGFLRVSGAVSRFWKHLPKSGIAVLALTQSACAASSQYARIGLTPLSKVALEVQALAARAKAGDKHAQLALGIRYEEGDGVPNDTKQARKLCHAAAMTTGGTIYVYVPATRKGGKGYVTPVKAGPVVLGLAEAEARLAKLKARRGGGK